MVGVGFVFGMIPHGEGKRKRREGKGEQGKKKSREGTVFISLPAPFDICVCIDNFI